MRSYLIGHIVYLLSTRHYSHFIPKYGQQADFFPWIHRYLNNSLKIYSSSELQQRICVQMNQKKEKKPSSECSIIDCFLWLHCTALIECDFCCFRIKSKEEKKINQSHYFASFACVRFSYPFFSSSKSLQLNWFDAFVFEAKSFNLLLNGWPLMCISTTHLFFVRPSTIAIFHLLSCYKNQFENGIFFMRRQK